MNVRVHGSALEIPRKIKGRKSAVCARAGNPTLYLVLLVTRWPVLPKCINHIDSNAKTSRPFFQTSPIVRQKKTIAGLEAFTLYPVIIDIIELRFN